MLVQRYSSLCRFLFVMILIVGVARTGSAADLYVDNFNGSSGVNLAGTTPDVTIGSNTWQGNTGFKADGSIANITGGIWLPFTATPGSRYVLSVTFFTNSSSGDWLGAGFSGGSTTSTLRFADNTGRGWAILKINSQQQSFIGPGATGQTSSGTINPGNQTSILTITLDALNANAANWTFSSTLKVNTTTYNLWTNVNANVTSPSQFTAIGLSAQSGIGRFTALSLTAVPEPSTYLFGMAGFILIVLRSRIRFD